MTSRSSVRPALHAPAQRAGRARARRSACAATCRRCASAASSPRSRRPSAASRGLSPFVRLGECVELDVGGQRRSSARWSASTTSGVTVKPFDGHSRRASAPRLAARLRHPQPACLLEGPHRQRARRADRRRRPAAAGRARRLDRSRAAARRCAAQRVRTPVKTGVRVIDLFTPLCAGQRIGIFAGSGIGKSTLLAHARPLARLRHRRHRAGRRARPRGARVPRGRARAASGRAPSPSSPPATKAR